MSAAVSVVIPVHNAVDVIVDQLDAVSVAMRGLDGAELLVVDNRSTDGSDEVVASWLAQRPGFPGRVVSAADKAGEPHARNVGWRAARGDVVLFCDADDVVSAGWARALVASLEHHEFATGPLDTSLLNDPRIADLRGQALFRERPLLADEGIPFAHGCNMGFRRSALERLGGFDETFLVACDIEIAVRAHRQGIGLAWVPEATVHYRLRSTPREVYRQARSYGRSRRRIRQAVTGAAGSTGWGHQGRRLAWLVRHIPSLGSFGGRMKWAWVAGQVAGEVGGRRWRP